MKNKIAVSHGKGFHYFSRRCSKCRAIEFPKYVPATKQMINKIKKWLSSPPPSKKE